jgi:serine protease Do
VAIQEVTRDIATSFGLDRPRGALVNSVEKGGPAEKAGIEELDIIVRYDGKPVEASGDLSRLVGSTRPGAQVSAELVRKGSSRTVSITVGELQEDRVASAPAPRQGAKPVEATPNRLGIVVAELSTEQKASQKLSHGIVVTDVRPEAKAELRRADVLLTLIQAGRHTELRSVEQFNKLLAGLGRDAVITLQVKRGEINALVTVNGLAERG